MPSDEMSQQLLLLQESFTAQTGQPFEHFYCPLLLKDENAQLCLGHIVPQCIPNCARARVVQRADVDNWFGSVAEADFATMVEAKAKGPEGIMFDESLHRRVWPKFIIEGEEVRHYPFDPNRFCCDHSRFIVDSESGEMQVRFVLAKSVEELSSQP